MRENHWFTVAPSDNFNIFVEEYVKILKKMEKLESDDESLCNDDSKLSFFTAKYWVGKYVDNLIFYFSRNLKNSKAQLINISTTRVPLWDKREVNPIEIAKYTIESSIANEPAF